MPHEASIRVATGQFGVTAHLAQLASESAGVSDFLVAARLLGGAARIPALEEEEGKDSGHASGRVQAKARSIALSRASLRVGSRKRAYRPGVKSAAR